MKSQQGFTLVELLIVIGIIAVLASVVLQRIDRARDKGGETKIIAELEGFHKNGMSEEIAAGTFNVVCGMNGSATGSALLNLSSSLQTNADNFVCNSTAVAFAASAELETGRHWCVDSIGTKKEIAAPLITGVVECP